MTVHFVRIALIYSSDDNANKKDAVQFVRPNFVQMDDRYIAFM